LKEMIHPNSIDGNQFETFLLVSLERGHVQNYENFYWDIGRDNCHKEAGDGKRLNVLNNLPQHSSIPRARFWCIFNSDRIDTNQISQFNYPPESPEFFV
jgi:hypothetical protein